MRLKPADRTRRRVIDSLISGHGVYVRKSVIVDVDTFKRQPARMDFGYTICVGSVTRFFLFPETNVIITIIGGVSESISFFFLFLTPDEETFEVNQKEKQVAIKIARNIFK